jgi:hypothetical protein
MLELPLMALMLVAPVEVEMKCPVGRVRLPGYASNQGVILLDGEVVPRPLAELGLGTDLEPASIDITCWDPDADAFSQRGVMVLRIQSMDMVAATRAPLLKLVEAQEAFRERHGHHATDLASLADFGFTPGIRLDFEATETGWSASTPDGDIAHRCSASEASASSRRDDGEPALDCSRVDTLALRSLRAYYDAAW